MPRIRCLAPALVLACFPALAHAAPVWIGDFESGDLLQWDGTLNGEVNGMAYINVVDDVVIQGNYAARVELHDDAVWPNGLRRVELHHGPAPGRTAEGQTVWFAWSFYLAETLPVDPGTTIGYWESDASYQQVMAFNASGETLRFITQRPSYQEQWVGDGVLTAGEWHRIAMRVLWSQDGGTGEVEVWFDGEQVLPGTTVQTLADGNDHFTQVGLLRGNEDFDDVPTIYLDDAIEGDAIEDVHPELDPGGSDSGDSTSGGPVDTTDEGGTTNASADESMGGSASETNGTATTNTTSADTTATGASTAGTGDTTGPGAGDDDANGGCGCTTDRRAPSFAGLLLLLLPLVRRRGRSVLPTPSEPLGGLEPPTY